MVRNRLICAKLQIACFGCNSLVALIEYSLGIQSHFLLDDKHAMLQQAALCAHSATINYRPLCNETHTIQPSAHEVYVDDWRQKRRSRHRNSQPQPFLGWLIRRLFR